MDFESGKGYNELKIGETASFSKTITETATVAEKIEEKRWIGMDLTWTNQHGKCVAEGKAVVIPPSHRAV